MAQFVFGPEPPLKLGRKPVTYGTGGGPLIRAMRQAMAGNNPYALPEMAAPPTVTVSATADAVSGLGTATALVASNAISPAAVAGVQFFGGVPKPVANAYVAMPVASSAPANGTLAAFANAFGITADMNQWASGYEIEITGSDTAELAFYMSSAKKIMFQVGGQYVSKAGHAAVTAGSADNHFKLVFPDAGPRVLRVMGSGKVTQCLPKSIRLKPGGTFSKPTVRPLKLAFFSDSYGEAFPYAHGDPRGAWATLLAEMLGFRDCRQVSVGTTGYVSTGSGRSKALDQMPFWLASQGPFDAMLWGFGYNDDGSSSAAVQAQVQACHAYARSIEPTTPIGVFGSQTGTKNNSAGILAVEAGIQAGVAAVNDRRFGFIPVSSGAQPWVTGTGYEGATNGSGNSDTVIGADHIHPTFPVGNEFLALTAAPNVLSLFEGMGL